MRIGILADIHGHVANLQRALAWLREEQVDRYVVLGDVIYNKEGSSETVALLCQHEAEGVWGNHDLGLGHNPHPDLLAQWPDEVGAFFATLSAYHEVENLLFSHSIPALDLTDPAEYYVSPRPDEPGALDSSFDRFPHRLLFVGHFHRWFVAAPDRALEWNGSGPIVLRPEDRFFVVIHAVLDGWCALFDSATNVLKPHRCSIE